MKTTVTTLLREFPKIRRAALAGETVFVVAKDATFRFELDRSNARVIGGLRGRVTTSDDSLDAPTSTDAEWME